MKTKLLLVSAMLGLALASTAQIIINRSDLGTLIGKVVIRANDSVNLNLLSPGSAGPNQTWNLTGIGNNYKDTMQFMSPSGTPCASSYPTATLGGKQGSMYFYIHDNSTVLEMLGFCGIFMPPNTSIVPYTPPEKSLTFPSTYNTAFNGQTKYVMKFPYNNPPYDSVKTLYSVSYESLMDGWGNVTTPTGTFASLRQKITTYQTDSTFIHSPSGGWMFSGPPSKDTTLDYSWLSQNNPFIADVATKWNGHVKSANYMISFATGVNEIQDNPDLSIFPNPSNGVFNLEFGNKDGSASLTTGLGFKNTQLSIYNTVGERVYSDKILTPQSLRLHLDLPKGMYFVELSNEHSILTKKIIIQ
jgi:hypothetical protein